MPIVENWSEVRSLMRSRRSQEVIHESRGVHVQTVRRNGMPQTITVPCSAGPVPRNMRDVLYEAERELAPSPSKRGRIKVDGRDVFGE